MSATFLIGLLAVPAVLLYLGNRLRYRSRTLQGVFWGAVAGHTLAIVPLSVAAGFPPAFWGASEPFRVGTIYLVLFLGSVVGATAGVIFFARGGE